MSGFVAVLETALPVFLALGLGMLCRSKGFLTRDGVDALKKVVMNFTLPFALLEAFATAEYNASALLLPLVMTEIVDVAIPSGDVGYIFKLGALMVVLSLAAR